MNYQLTEAQVIQFSDQVHQAAQQTKSRLSGRFPIKKMIGKEYAYDGVGSIEAQELTGRFNRVEFSDLKITRRKIGRRRFSLTLPIDADDVSKVLLNPESEYKNACAMAMARVHDRIAVEASFASVMTGEEMSTPVTASADGVVTVDATAGLIYEKLLEISQNFIDNDVGNDMPESFFMGISGDEHTQLMNETMLTSGDYSRQYVVDKGTVQQALGLELIKFAASSVKPVLPVASTVRSLPVMTGRSLCFAMPAQFEIIVEKRTDMVQVRQVQINWTLGATRTEGVLVQKVNVTKT